MIDTFAFALKNGEYLGNEAILGRIFAYVLRHSIIFNKTIFSIDSNICNKFRLGFEIEELNCD